jgi:hypothetical protein
VNTFVKKNTVPFLDTEQKDLWSPSVRPTTIDFRARGKFATGNNSIGRETPPIDLKSCRRTQEMENSEQV